MSKLRSLTITLPEPLSLNALLRMSYHLRNQRREMLKRKIAEQLPDAWKPLKYARVSAELTLSSLRDPFELPACLKIELDAAQEVGLIWSDGPMYIARGEVTQRKGSPRGVTLHFEEMPCSPLE